MEKALEILKQVRYLSGWIKSGAELPFDDELDEAIAEIEALQEENNILKHNYDVQVEYNNTAYKNYTNMVNSLKQRIEAMKPKTCDGCSNLFFDEIEKVYKCSNDVSDDVGYLHGEAVIRNIKDFHCVQHQPKDNQ